MKKKKKKVEQSKADTSTKKDLPSYLELLNSKPVNDKVGKVFITSTKKRMEK